MSEETPNLNDNQALEARIRALENQVKALETQLEALAGNHEQLAQRLLRLSLATQPHPRFPYWTWYIRHHLPEHDRERLETVLMLLCARVDKLELPEALHKPIPGIAHEVLYGPSPLRVEDISAAVKYITGLKHESQIVELFEAIQGQGMFQSLCTFYLAQCTGTRTGA
jgi:hypothetical protein